MGIRLLSALGLIALLVAAPAHSSDAIRAIEPPEGGFYAKVLEYDGIPIKAPAVVDDRALFIARDRLTRMLKNLPDVRYNLRVAGAELHIIGKDQVTSDLPEHRHLKGIPFDGDLTVDQRTRGLGGLLTSCGEENLLELPADRYRGRDICTHEFAHNVQQHGVSDAVRQQIRDQYHRSLEKALWKGSYAASNEGEFFAELTMWYFGTHGDLHMEGPTPENGPDGLRKYDPEAFTLLDDFYSGRISVSRTQTVALRAHAPADGKDLRSGAGTHRTEIRFVNRTAGELKLYWIDEAGERHAYGTVPARGGVSKSTFASHVWLVADPDDHPLAYYVAADQPGTATVRQ